MGRVVISIKKPPSQAPISHYQRHIYNTFITAWCLQ